MAHSHWLSPGRRCNRFYAVKMVVQILLSLSFLSRTSFSHAHTWAHAHTQRETNIQARPLLETRTAPALQQFKQLFRCFNFTRIWLRACKAQRQHLNGIITCAPTSEQGWNCSWLPQSLATATCNAQISRGRLGSFPWLLAIHCAGRLLMRARHRYRLVFMKLFLISPWTRYTSFFWPFRATQWIPPLLGTLFLLVLMYPSV